MFGDLQQWLVLLIMLVPGFIVTGIQRGFRPKLFATQFDWFATSVLYGISLNAVFLIFLLIVVPGAKALTVDNVSNQLKTLKFSWIAFYFFGLYLLSLVMGSLSGKWPAIGLRAVLNRFGITQYGEHSSVWARVFDKQVPSSKNAIWVKISMGSAPQIFGRLRHSSAQVEQDKPIEVYISPYYELTDKGWKRPSLSSDGEVSNGIYLKITDENSVEFFFRDQEWEFEKDGNIKRCNGRG